MGKAEPKRDAPSRRIKALASRLAAFLLLIVLVAVAGTCLGIAYLERRWTILFAVKEVPEQAWALPEGAEKVAFSTADSVRLAGWYLEAIPPRKGITILMLHGNVGVLPRYVPDAQFMRQRGFNVLLFNYRGFGMSDGVTESEATLDRDAAAALRYLTKERGINPQSVAFVGASFGAPIAANLAARSPCRAVALVSGIASAKRQMQLARPWVPALVLDNLSSPLDTVRMIGRAKCPVLVIHGGNDTVVPMTDAQAVYDAARPPKRLIVVPEGGHGFDAVDHAIFLEPMISFFVNY
jgi:uncharacterized protein